MEAENTEKTVENNNNERSTEQDQNEPAITSERSSPPPAEVAEMEESTTEQQQEEDPDGEINFYPLLTVFEQKSTAATLTVVLLFIRRFLIDQRFHSLFDNSLSVIDDHHDMRNHARENGNIAYDLIVSDQSGKVLKMTLNPKWNTRVMSGEIREGILIQITNYRMLFDEMVQGGGSGLLLVHELNELEVSLAHRQPLKEFCAELKLKLELQWRELWLKPVVSARQYYLPLWDDDNFESCERLERLSVEQQESIGIDCQYLSTVDSGTMTRRGLIKGNLIGRVHKKTQLNLWRDESNAFPFSFMILLVDESLPKGVPVIVWNRFALNYYRDINVGDVLLIIDYELKPISESDRYFLPMEHSNVKVSVNPHKTKLYQIEDATTEFAPLDFRLVSMKELHRCVDGTLVNVAGVVVRVSMFLRERVHFDNEMSHIRPRYTQFRYVTLLDQSLKYVHCKLYTNSRKDQLDDIEVGRIMVLTDMLVVSACPSSWISQREFLLQTTFVSSISIEDELLSLYSQETKDYIQSLHSFAANQQDRIDKLVEYGTMSYFAPHLKVPTFQLYQQLYPKINLEYFRTLCSIKDNMQHMETKMIAVQANVVSLSRVGMKKRKRQANEKQSKRKKQLDMDPITQSQSQSDDEEEELEMEDNSTSPEEYRDYIPYSVLLTDMNNTSTLALELYLWKFDTFHQVNELSEEKYSSHERLSLCKFFAITMPELSTNDNDEQTKDVTAAISESLKDKLFIFSIQAVRITDQVHYLLSQSFPVQ